jgi:hypothetical protein
MPKNKVDLRKDEWREAIIEISNTLKNISMTDRALALLIADSSTVSLTQAIEVLKAIPNLGKRYLKRR